MLKVESLLEKVAPVAAGSSEYKFLNDFEDNCASAKLNEVDRSRSHQH